MFLWCKARYTLAIKLNSTRSTLLKVDCCRNRQQSRQQSQLLPYTFNFVADTVHIVAGRVNKSATAWIRQLVAVNFVPDTFDFVEFNFVDSVYRALCINGWKYFLFLTLFCWVYLVTVDPCWKCSGKSDVAKAFTFKVKVKVWTFVAKAIKIWPLVASWAKRWQWST